MWKHEPSPWRIEWQESLGVHIPEIDTEHKRFIVLVNALNESIAERMPLDEVQRRMQELFDDASAHFEHEERLFREWGYPEAAQHAAKHEALLKALQEIMRRVAHTPVGYEWVAAGLQIKALLVNHLLDEDMKYRDDWLAKNAVAGGAVSSA